MLKEPPARLAHRAGQDHFILFGSYGETLTTPSAWWGEDTNKAFWRGFYQERQDLMEMKNGTA